MKLSPLVAHTIIPVAPAVVPVAPAVVPAVLPAAPAVHHFGIWQFKSPILFLQTHMYITISY